MSNIKKLVKNIEEVLDENKLKDEQYTREITRLVEDYEHRYHAAKESFLQLIKEKPTLNKQRVKIKATCDDLEEVIRGFEAKLKREDDNYKTLLEYVQSSEEEILDLKQEVEVKEEGVRKKRDFIKSERERLDSELRSIEDEIKTKEQNIKDMEAERISLKEDSEKLKVEIVEYTEKVSEKAAQEKELSLRNEPILEEHAAIAKEHQELLATNKALEDKILVLQNDFEASIASIPKIKAESARFAEEKIRLEERIQSLKTEKDKLKDDFEAVSYDFAGVESVIKELREEKVDVLAQIEKLRYGFEFLQNSSKEKNSQKDGLEADIANLEQEKNRLTANIDDKKKLLEMLSVQIPELSEKKIAQENTAKELAEKLKEYEAKSNEQGLVKDKLLREVSSLEKRNAEAKLDIETLQKGIAKQIAENRAHDKIVQRLQNKFDTALSHLSKLYKNRNELKKQNELMLAQQAKMKQIFKEKEKEYKRVALELNQVKEEIAKIKTAGKQTDHEILTTKSAIKQKTEQLANLTAKAQVAAKVARKNHDLLTQSKVKVQRIESAISEMEQRHRGYSKEYKLLQSNIDQYNGQAELLSQKRDRVYNELNRMMNNIVSLSKGQVRTISRSNDQLSDLTAKAQDATKAATKNHNILSQSKAQLQSILSAIDEMEQKHQNYSKEYELLQSNIDRYNNEAELLSQKRDRVYQELSGLMKSAVSSGKYKARTLSHSQKMNSDSELKEVLNSFIKIVNDVEFEGVEWDFVQVGSAWQAKAKNLNIYEEELTEAFVDNLKRIKKMNKQIQVDFKVKSFSKVVHELEIKSYYLEKNRVNSAQL